jgi:hypothetical protein
MLQMGGEHERQRPGEDGLTSAQLEAHGDPIVVLHELFSFVLLIKCRVRLHPSATK